MKKFISIVSACIALCTGPAVAKELGIADWTTSQGARVLFLQATEIPMVDISIDVDAGSRWDPATQSGLASMTQGMLARGWRAAAGQPALNENAISEAFAELAVQRGGSAGLDRASLSLRTLSDGDVRVPAVRLMARLMAHPSFDAQILEREKNRSIASIKESLTQPQSIATKALWKSVYGDHPYGQSATPESIAAITAKDLEAFHRQYWQPNRMRVTIVGNLTEPQARELADGLFEFFPRQSAQPTRPSAQKPAALVRTGPVRQAIAHPATQSHLWLGMPGIARDDPDFFALTVGNYIFGGGGFVSRLTEEIREKRGLSYSVFSAFQPLAQPGPFMIGLQTQNSRAPQALQVVEDTLARFLKEGPTEKELHAAKQNLVGGFALRVDTNRKLLDNLAQINYYDMPLDYLYTWTSKIESVTVADVKRAMNRVVQANQLSVVVVAGPEGFAP
jgi:zinc protease